MSDLGLSLLLVHAGATLFMTGLVWFVQVVHYPLFARVGEPGFAGYEIDHTRRTNWVVAPVMGLEALTAGLLLLVRPAGVPIEALAAGAALLGAIWLSTFALQVPRHGQLCRGFDAGAHRALVRSNWLRTVAWTLRSGLVLVWVAIAAGAA